MYIDIVPTRKSPPAVLLRQSRREGGKIVQTTLANLSTCPPEAVEALRLALRGYPGVGWISALRCPAIRTLAEHGACQPSLFDTPHLAEITSDAYPGERLVVCDNPALAADRQRTRDELLTATEARLARIAAAVARRTTTTNDGWPVQSLRTVLSALGTRCKNTCRAGTGTNVLRFEQLTETSPFQQHVFSLL